MRVPTAEQLVGQLAEITDIVRQLEDGASIPTYDESGRLTGHRRTPGVQAMLDLALAATRDGYPTRSFGGGSAPSTLLDENGDAMPPLSDPVGELVVSGGLIDPIRYHRESVIRGVAGALGDLRMALSALAHAFDPDETSPGEPACRSHMAIGVWELAVHNGRCRWCYDFWLAEGVDPPAGLLEARRDGKRITRPMVDLALKSVKAADRIRSKKRRLRLSRR